MGQRRLVEDVDLGWWDWVVDWAGGCSWSLGRRVMVWGWSELKERTFGSEWGHRLGKGCNGEVGVQRDNCCCGCVVSRCGTGTLTGSTCGKRSFGKKTWRSWEISSNFWDKEVVWNSFITLSACRGKLPMGFFLQIYGWWFDSFWNHRSKSSQKLKYQDP